mgnify:CR=1 FL=1
MRTGTAVQELAADGDLWRVHGEPFDRVLLACPARAAEKDERCSSALVGAASTATAARTTMMSATSSVMLTRRRIVWRMRRQIMPRLSAAS